VGLNGQGVGVVEADGSEKSPKKQGKRSALADKPKREDTLISMPFPVCREKKAPFWTWRRREGSALHRVVRETEEKNP